MNFPVDSGGQRQRISIARALMVDPEFIVAVESFIAAVMATIVGSPGSQLILLTGIN